MNTYQAKITPPRLRDAVPRERLFSLLDNLSDYPVTWVSSPAGAGKTTLVASYVRTRGIPALWYRVDEADSDVASFFYYMGEAAKGLRKGRSRPLPLFTPEYRLGISAFTRHYFESLFNRMSRPGIIVFDNYQDGPEDSEFHEVLKNGLKLVPKGIRVLLASRKEFPKPFVSLKAESMLAGLGWDDVRFTVDEVREMVHRRKKVPEEMVQHIHKKARGWATAVILMLDKEEMPSISANSIGQSSVFDYFTVEIFRTLDQRLKDFLLVSALLPSISPDIVSQMTGVEESDTILSNLYRNQYFTDRYGKDYRFHPLFRDFLLSEAKKRYGREELLLFTVKAGHLLARYGQTEEAIGLLLDAGAHGEVLPLMLGHARELLSHGRISTLEEWASRLPQNLRDHTPWLTYWLGMGRLVTDPADAERHLLKAFSLFESQEERTGCLLSAAAIMNSIMLKWDDYKPLDRWIDWIDNHVDLHTPLPSPEMEAHVASAMVCGLTWRQPWHRNMERWIERTLRASEKVEDRSIRFMAKGNVIEYRTIVGNFEEMRALAKDMRDIAFSPQATLLVHLAYMVRIAELHDYVHGSWPETLDLIRKGISLAERVGAYIHMGIIYFDGIIAAFELDDLDLAADFLSKSESLATDETRVIRARFLSIRAFYHLRRGNTGAARRDAEKALQDSLDTGAHLIQGYCGIALACVLARSGDMEKARVHLRVVEKLIAPLDVTHILYLVRLTEASALFGEDRREEGRRNLAETFRIGRTKEYAFTLYYWWQPREMARLCAEALAAGIEVDYAKEVIRRHNLTPEGRPEMLKDWPWPVRIRTLGRFGIEVSEEPLTFTHKVQRKPLSLLKAVIAMGGRDVREESLQDLLWPEAEGDAAHRAFKSAIFRLRRLLGNDRAIEVKEGKVSLNPEVVWIDTRALESLAERVSQLHRDRRLDGNADGLENLASLAIDFYQGDFLSTEEGSWIDRPRRRLRKCFTDIIPRLADMLRKAGRADEVTLLREAADERNTTLRDHQ